MEMVALRLEMEMYLRLMAWEYETFYFRNQPTLYVREQY
jgi:hypothetical protein